MNNIIKKKIGPFHLEPGESKELFEIDIPIPEGATPEEALEMVKKHGIYIEGTYQDKNGKEYRFRQHPEYEKNRKINKYSIINLVIGIGLLIEAAYFIKTNLVAVAIIWIFLAIVNFYCVYRYGIMTKNDQYENCRLKQFKMS